MSGDVLIRAEKATKIYHPGLPDEWRALHSLSVDLYKGEVTVLKGPSGSGKTTLLSLVGCMSRPTEGSVLVEGKDVAKLPERFLTDIRRRTFGFIFQQLNLIRDVSAMENIMLPLYPTAMPAAAMKEKARALLKKFRIEEKGHRRVKRLSGGEQQRVAIARALVNEPAVVIADEPTAHLDSDLSGEMMSSLSMLKEEGKTILIATHDSFVHDHPLVDRTITMRDGRIEGAVPA